MITEANIRRAIGEPSFSRGESYFRRGMVSLVEIVSSEQITSEVRGSGRKSYTQTIGMVFSKGRDLTALNGICSCPVGFNCKHVVAAMLTARDELNRLSMTSSGLVAERSLDPARSPPPKKQKNDPRIQKLPGAVQVWLGNWGRPPAEPKELRPDPAKAPSGERLFYVFKHERLRDVIILPFKGPP